MASSQELKSTYSEKAADHSGSSARDGHTQQRVVAPDQNLQSPGSNFSSSGQQSYMQANIENQYSQLRNETKSDYTVNQSTYTPENAYDTCSSYSDNAQNTILEQTHLEHSDADNRMDLPDNRKPLGNENTSAYNQMDPKSFEKFKEYLNDHSPADVMMDPLLGEARKLFRNYNPVHPGELVKLYGVSPGRAAKVIKAMEKEGIIAKKDNADEWVSASPSSAKKDGRMLPGRDPRAERTKTASAGNNYYQKKKKEAETETDLKNFNVKNLSREGDENAVKKGPEVEAVKTELGDKAVLKKEVSVNAHDEKKPEPKEKKELTAQQKRDIYVKPKKEKEVLDKDRKKETGTGEPKREDPDKLNCKDEQVKAENPKIEPMVRPKEDPLKADVNHVQNTALKHEGNQNAGPEHPKEEIQSPKMRKAQRQDLYYTQKNAAIEEEKEQEYKRKEREEQLRRRLEQNRTEPKETERNRISEDTAVKYERREESIKGNGLQYNYVPPARDEKLEQLREKATRYSLRYGRHERDVYADSETLKKKRFQGYQRWKYERNQRIEDSMEKGDAAELYRDQRGSKPVQRTGEERNVSLDDYSADKQYKILVHEGQMVLRDDGRAGYISQIEDDDRIVVNVKQKNGRWVETRFDDYDSMRAERFQIVDYVGRDNLSERAKKNLYEANKQVSSYRNLFHFNEENSREVKISGDEAKSILTSMTPAAKPERNAEKDDIDQAGSTGQKSIESQIEYNKDKYTKINYSKSLEDNDELAKHSSEENLVRKDETEEFVRHDLTDEEVRSSEDNGTNPNVSLKAIEQEINEGESSPSVLLVPADDGEKGSEIKGPRNGSHGEVLKTKETKTGFYRQERIRQINKDGTITKTGKEALVSKAAHQPGDYWKKEFREAEEEEGNELVKGTEEGVTRIVRNQTRPFLENHLGHGRDAYKYQKYLAKDEAKKKTDAWVAKQEADGKTVSAASRRAQERKNYNESRKERGMATQGLFNNTFTRMIGNFVDTPLTQIAETIKRIRRILEMIVTAVTAIVSGFVTFVSVVVGAVVTLLPVIAVPAIIILLVAMMFSGFTNLFFSGGIIPTDIGDIDFGSKYYTFNVNPNLGNVCVCDPANSYAWPYNNCSTGHSVTGKFNKMICSSYAAGRYWEVNYHDDPFPLPRNWDHQLTILHLPPGSGEFSRDANNPIEHSICSISMASGVKHDCFIEKVNEDGSVVISECNVTSANEYGFRCNTYASLRDYLLSMNATLNGMYGK